MLEPLEHWKFENIRKMEIRKQKELGNIRN